MIDSFSPEYVVCRKGVAGEGASAGAVPRRARVTSLLLLTHGSINNTFPGSYYQNESRNTAKNDAKDTCPPYDDL
jgi:hypothetical protein